MSMIRTVVLAVGIAAFAGLALAAKSPSDAERKRAEAQDLCYDGVQRHRGDAVPDEGRVVACMKVKRAQLSQGCSRVLEARLGG